MAENMDPVTEGNLAKVYDLVQQPSAQDHTEAIHKAIDQCLITMVYQPIVDLQTGAVFAYEALCRSRLPQFDSPPALIEAATAVGRIDELGRLQRRLASRNCADYPIFVNISPHEFDDVFLVRPDDAIFRHRKPVYIEITESVPLVFFDQCHSVLGELRRKGARLAIDDLGAGYSNLKYIADLAPDIVKLDRELVAGCTRQGAQYKLLCSIAKLCREVDAKVVAEGVESAEELDAVTSAGIELCQGFFLSRPKSSPPEVCWPASDLLASGRMAEIGAAARRTRSKEFSEDEERRVEEMEELSNALEKSVRRARGEVVRLRKALGKAEDRNKRAKSRLAEVESSLAQSESERDRLARLFEAEQPSEEEAPQGGEAAPSVAGRASTPEPARGWSARRVAVQALIWSTGLAAGLALYHFDAERRATAALPASLGVEARPIEAPGPAEVAPIVESRPTTSAPRLEAVAQEEIGATLESWAAAWSSQDVDSYLSHYSSAFVSENGLSGAAWNEGRRERLMRPSFIQVKVEELTVVLEEPELAVVTFTQAYDSDTFTDRLRKEMTLALEDGGWRILRESASG